MSLRVKGIYTPPGGWRYKSQHTGVLIRSGNRKDLFRAVHDYETANGYALTSPEDIEDQLCNNCPPGTCGDPTATNCFVDTSDLLAGMQAVAKLLWEVATPWNEPWVPQAEAERRADICRGCLKNTEVTGCGTCHSFTMAKQQIAKVKGERSVPREEELHGCCVCLCDIASIVHVRLGILQTGLTEGQRQRSPSFCWKLDGLEPVEPA